MVEILGVAGWQMRVEVSYSHFGERGSMDILAWHEASRTLLVIEIKSELTSVESTLRKPDEKERLAPMVSAERFGWRPRAMGVLLVVRESSADRARAGRPASLLSAAVPTRSVAVKAWLRRPEGGLRGLWFLSSADGGGGMRPGGGVDRVRRSVRSPC